MRRAIALVIASTLVAGCKGTASLAPLDPFARTTVAPPGTDFGGTPPAGNPLRPVPPQGGAAAPSTTPGAIVPSNGGQYSPPGGSFQLQGTATVQPSPPTAAAQPGDRIGIPIDARDLSRQPRALAGDSEPNHWSTAAGVDAGSLAPATMASSRSSTEAEQPATPSAPAIPERFVQTIEPRTGGSRGDQDRVPVNAASAASGGNPTEAEPDMLPSAEGIINIMDLPPAGAINMVPMRAGADGIVLASATEVIDSTATATRGAGSGNVQVRPNLQSPLVRYDYSGDYGRLRGQLEFSAISQRWKLRYIPIDGRSDDFGGSVLILNPETLSGCQRGDFVEVRGRLDTNGTDDRHFTPEYEIAEIQRLAE